MKLIRQPSSRAVIAIWLGHELVESPQMYVPADIQIKERAMAKTAPVAVSPQTTSCSRSWKDSDHADISRTCPMIQADCREECGITRKSA